MKDFIIFFLCISWAIFFIFFGKELIVRAVKGLPKNYVRYVLLAVPLIACGFIILAYASGLFPLLFPPYRH